MKKQKKTKTGAAMVFVVGFILLSSVLSAALLLTASTHGRISSRQVDMEKAFAIAEGGLERSAAYIIDQRGYIFYSTPRSYTVGDGVANVIIEPAAWREAAITSTGTVNGVSVVLHVKRAFLPSYATFALWSQQNNPIYFTAGEQFFGKIHANDTLYFSSSEAYGGPVFWDKVTSGASSYSGNADFATFHDGFEYPMPMATLQAVDFDDLHNLAQSHGLVLEGATKITLDEGVVRITNARAGMNDTAVVLGPQQMVYVKDSNTGDSSNRAGKVSMEGGQLAGRLTVVAENDIVIKDHLTYLTDPRVDPTSTDALGLISKDDVWIGTGAPDNINIHGAIMATGQRSNNRGSFGALDYSSGSPRGEINLLGSIVQDLRGPVGTFNSRGPVSGFRKQYAFDERFEQTAPPFYPTISEELRFEGWEQR